MTHFPPLTIVELVAAYPSLFYLNNQGWWRGEAFTRYLPTEIPAFPPDDISFVGKTPPRNARLCHAVDLLNAYVKQPNAAIWSRFLWTADVDAKGQRVFIGGCANTGVIEIHRHLHLTENFGVPLWRAA